MILFKVSNKNMRNASYITKDELTDISITPENIRKSFGFLMFSGGIEM